MSIRSDRRGEGASTGQAPRKEINLSREEIKVGSPQRETALRHLTGGVITQSGRPGPEK